MNDPIDATTGNPFRLFRSSAYYKDLADWEDTACQHPKLALCEHTDAGGNKHLRKQCQVCGELKGSAVGRAAAGNEEIVSYKPDLQDAYDSVREKGREAIIQKHIAIQKAKSGERSELYDTHINSPKWKQIRLKVLKRANGLCEGCLEREPRQVHHTTYDHLGDEFMFELLAVCDECHARLHPELQQDEMDAEEIEAEIARLECQCRWSDFEVLNPQCGKFGVPVKDAIAPNGECGPRRKAHEELK